MAISPQEPPPVPAARDWRAELRALLSWRRILRRMRAVLRSALVTFVVLTLTLWLMPGVASADVIDTLGLVVLIAAVGAVLRPLLLVGVVALGGWGAMLLGVLAQIAVIVVALELDPANRITGLPSLVIAAILAIVFAAILDWAFDSGSDDTFVREARRLMRGVRRRQARQAGGPLLTLRRSRPGTEPGLIMVQLDGVAEPVLRWSVRAGNLPTLGLWLRSGSHSLCGWHTGLPSTTPASQAGILHGATRQIPAFRWFEKETGRLMVSSRPRDAAVIEPRLSDGRGLLRDGGVSIGNAFGGDAAINLLTVSHAALPGRSARGWAAFMASPYGFTRALVLGVGEVFVELRQARLQRLRNLLPRVSRSGRFLALRPAAMLLRDVNISLVAEQMARGAPAIYCDLVDYDEVAHHAGPARPESMRQLESLDRMLGVLERLAPEAARHYHLVVLSDHGQSQGATFRQRYGETLDEVVDRLSAPSSPAPDPVEGPTASVETLAEIAEAPAASAVRSAVPGVAPAVPGVAPAVPGVAPAVPGVAPAVPGVAPAVPGVASVLPGGADALASTGEEQALDEPTSPESPVAPLLVVSSGNLSLVYLTRYRRRLGRCEIDRAYPRLVSGLATHPGIGLVVVNDTGGPVAVGAAGSHRLCDGVVEGVDPLLPYGPHARHDLLRHQESAHIGDLVLISAVDHVTDEVAAFEELVGSHGGLGGWQTEAMLVHPARWPLLDQELDGPDAVHRQLVAWLQMLGLRAPEPVPPPALERGEPISPIQSLRLPDQAESRLSPSRDR